MFTVGVRILVGFDEDARTQLHALLVEELLQRLARSTEADRRATVLDLVQRIRRGQLRVGKENAGHLLARIHSKDHAKVYLFDKELAVVGSSNLSRSGLCSNSEAMTLVKEPQRVQTFQNAFEQRWNADTTEDLTEALLAALLRWLSLDPPYHIYLHTVAALDPKEEIEAPRANYKMPVDYQRPVVERVLRQLQSYGGSMLVASTGLGKTVMATHVALRLARNGTIDNVLVFAPKAVRPNWRHDLRSAGLSGQVLIRNVLDMSRSGPAVRDLEDALAYVDERYLVIVDESQYYRNRVRQSGDAYRRSFERLAIARERGAKILLLTATPYSRGLDDLNNQLHLLPHSAPASVVMEKRQFVIPGLLDEILPPYRMAHPGSGRFL